MRIILGIIAFTLTFGLSATLVGVLFGFPQTEARSFVSTPTYSSAQAKNINQLLKRDDFYGNIRNQTYYKLYKGDGDFETVYSSDEYHQSIIDYYNKSSSINDSFLPQDLKYAWREHMNAWKQQAEYVKSLKDKSYQDGDTTVQTYSDNTNEINRTWFQVLRITERYGVETSSFR